MSPLRNPSRIANASMGFASTFARFCFGGCGRSTHPTSRGLRRRARKRYLESRVRQINPTGKALLIFRNNVKPGNQKYSAFAVGQISGMNMPVSPDERGVAHVTNARWDAVDAWLAEDERRPRGR